MTWQVWLAFLGASIAISVSRGAGAIQSMATGLTHGLRRCGPATAVAAHSAATDCAQPSVLRPVRDRCGGAVAAAPRRRRL